MKLLGVFCASIALLATASANARVLPDTGTWMIRGAHASEVNFELRVATPSGSHTWGTDLSLDRLRKLSRSDLNSSGTAVSFDVLRDAGTLHCIGHVAAGNGAGTFRFVPSTTYVARLAALDVAAPNATEQRQMAFSDVSVAFVETLRENQYVIRRPSELIRIAEHGVTSQFVSMIGQLGYYLDGGEGLVRFADHGVSVGYIEALRALGYRPTAAELVRLVDHGVSATFVEATKSLGNPTPLEESVRMVDHGVTIDFVRSIVAMGYRPTTEQLVALTDHGVGLDFVRKATARGNAVSIDRLIRLRDTGE